MKTTTKHARRTRATRALAATASLALLTAACGGDDDADTTSEETTDTGETTDNGDSSGEASGSSIMDGDIPCDNQYEGETISIFSPARDSENDLVATELTSYYQPFMDCTGAEIVWEGSDQFETEINVRLEGGDPPDVIDYPQPGLMAQHVARGFLPELPDDVADDLANFTAGWDAYATVDGGIYALPNRSSIKSLIWYSPAAFEEGGYEIPESLEDLKALSDQIAADGGIPWCIGAESGVATGWVLTDWIEDFMLRTNGEDVYDQWVNHEIPFNDPQVVEAIDAVGEIVKNPDYLGGQNLVTAIATTKFQDGGLPILSGDCYMHRQASFYAGLWPEGTTLGEDGDIDAFYLPSPAGGPAYMLGAGDLYAAGVDSPAAFDTVRYSGSLEYLTAVAEGRGELVPHTGVSPSVYPDPFDAKLAELQAGAEIFRFDGSDLMPGAVGAGSFWTEVTDWVIGGDTQTFVDNVEATWPSS